MHDLNTSEGVTAHMSESTSEADWNLRCDQVRKANGGYPDFWFTDVIMAGLPERTLGPGAGEINIKPL